MPISDKERSALMAMGRSARQALLYNQGRTIDDLGTISMFTDAVHRRLELIGEAARRISDAVRLRHPDVPWLNIIRTRHRIAHSYDTIDKFIVWKILDSHLPSLMVQIDRIIESEEGDR